MCVFVCVCVCERERERENDVLAIQSNFLSAEIRSIALGIGISLVSIGIICAFICTIIRNVHKRKGNFVPMPTTNAPNISTMLGTGLNDQNRQSHSYITRRGGTNVDDIALQLNVRYSRASFNPTDTKHQGSRENESSYLYDDVIVVSQSASQQPRQNSQVLPQSVALPVRCDLHSKQHFETASESTDNDNNSLQEQSPDYVISSINSLVLENAKKTFPVDRYDSPLATPAYENVDPANGLPIAPQGERIIMVRSGWTTRGTGEPERATLPLAGVHRVQQRVSKPRAQSAAPVIEPADYEEPVATLTRGQKLKKMTK